MNLNNVQKLWANYTYFRYSCPKKELPKLKPTDNILVKYLFSLYGPFVECDSVQKVIDQKSYREEGLERSSSELIHYLNKSLQNWKDYAYKLQGIVVVSLSFNIALLGIVIMRLL